MTCAEEEHLALPVEQGTSADTLADCVRRAVQTYFDDLEGDDPGGLYHLVMAEVERPLLETVLARTRSNQSQAARLLGINRATLRKKLHHHGLA
jgi:Fis family transcriptional regulator